jgi:RNA polymerase sigma factor (sigma-70 family)
MIMSGTVRAGGNGEAHFMASGQEGTLLREIHQLFAVGTAVGSADEDLVAQFAARRDEAAFRALLARHGPIVLSVCRRRLRDPRDAEDAFQATFLVFIRKAGSVKKPHLLGPWLYGVADRVARRAQALAARRGERERTGEFLESLDVEHQGHAARSAEHDELRAVLDQEINRLPEMLRLPVVLCHVEGLTQPEAATRLRTTPDSVRGRLSRARETLRSRLTRRGLALSGGIVTLDLAADSACAALPASLTEATLELMKAGAAPPAAVAYLAEGVIRAMPFFTLKAIAGVAFAVAIGAAVASAIGTAKSNDRVEAVVNPSDPLPARPPVTDQLGKSEKSAASAAAPGSHPLEIKVEARDFITDTPVPGVQIELVASDMQSRPKATTDASGTARFSLPGSTGVKWMKAYANRDGFVPLGINWTYNFPSAVAPPDHLLFQLEKVATIGGRVVDQDQKPLAGATVFITARKRYPKSEQWVAVAYDGIPADASGRWTFSGVPERPDAIELAAHHPSCLSEIASFQMKEFTPLSALRDGTAVLKLERGTPIELTVVGPDQKPVPYAEILYGEGRRFANAIPDMKADAHGRFTLGIKRGTVTSITARSPGFGPAGQTIRGAAEPQQITLSLPAGRKIGGRVVDRAGRPIAGASLSVGWSPLRRETAGRGSEALSLDLTTDADGRFVWNDGPGDGAHAEVYAPGHLGRDTRLSAGVQNEIVLTAKSKIKGTVVDAETGKVIPQFMLTYSTIWNAGEQFVSQRISGMDANARKAPGSFEYTFDMAAEKIIVRVQSNDHLPADSEPFAPDGSLRELTFRLTRAAPITGKILNADGTPARDVTVYLVPAGENLNLENGEVHVSYRRGSIQRKTAADGGFSLPPQRDDYQLVALAEAGVVMARRRDLHGNDSLLLKPWARVAGTMKVEGKPAAGIGVTQSPDDLGSQSEGEPQVYHRLYTETDAAGRFEFRRMVPGRHSLGHWVSNGAPGRRWFVSVVTFDAQSGQTINLNIGGAGLAVTGRLALPTSGGWMIRKASLEPSGAKDPLRVRGVEVLEDGRLRIQDLEPGEYKLRISIHEPPPADECGWGRLIAGFSHLFKVSDDANGSPLDLGNLEPAETGGQPLSVGAGAPDFTVKTLDGKELKLADFKGKLVLLDFWATWCAPCVTELANLKAIHEALGTNPQLVMVALSVDEEPDVVRSFVKSQKLSWLQGYLGPDSKVADAYGATAIPATFLIGPDGRILARDLRGSETRKAIEKALGR